MAKKVKAKKTTTTKKKESTTKAKVQEEVQPDVTMEAQAIPDEGNEAPEPPGPEAKPAEVPMPAPSVAVTTREQAPVPVSVPVTPSEPPPVVESAAVETAGPSEEVAPGEPGFEEAPVTTQMTDAVEASVSTPPSAGIVAILNVKTEEDAAVNETNLAAYLAYVQQNLERPTGVCGREPFGWERVYAWGLRDRAEYEKRKASCPSYTDALEIVGLEEQVDCTEGIVARVSRTADGKEFTLPLAWLKSVDPESKSAEILDEFATWLAERS